jgi:excisionase family DNA binding protein
MTQELYSVYMVAERLGLHVKTVRAYVRDGRLKATRIGKQYRIAREDLEAFTGQTAEREAIARTRHVEVSTVVHIDAASRELHDRLSTTLNASLNGRAHASPVRIDYGFDAERARLKIIISADAEVTASLLRTIGFFAGDTP